MTDKDKDAEYPHPKYSITLHVKEVFNATTQLINAILGSCDANQSTSERAYWNRGKFGWDWLYKTINFLAWRETDHCYKAKVKEDGRAINRLENQGYVVQKMSTVTNPSKEAYKPFEPSQDVIDDLYANAEDYELNQALVVDALVNHADDYVAAAKVVDWYKIVEKYDTTTLDRIMEYGTNMNLSPLVNTRILEAVRKERSIRNTGEAPATNGMGEDGRMQ